MDLGDNLSNQKTSPEQNKCIQRHMES